MSMTLTDRAQVANPVRGLLDTGGKDKNAQKRYFETKSQKKEKKQERSGGKEKHDDQVKRKFEAGQKDGQYSHELRCAIVKHLR